MRWLIVGKENRERSNLFIYQAGPSRASDGSVSAEALVYEAFDVIGELGVRFSALLAWHPHIDKPEHRICFSTVTFFLRF